MAAKGFCDDWKAGENAAMAWTEKALAAAGADTLNCLTLVDRQRAEAQSREAQRRIDAGLTGPLTGLPYVAEDGIMVEHQISSGGSRMLANFAPPFGAEVIRRLDEAGLVLLGKANMGELKMGGEESSYFGPVTHPLDAGRRSGGAAAAVAAGIVPLALAVDSLGEVRRQAAQAGVVCCKPSYGTVSRFGVIANVSSCEQIAAIAPVVAEAAELLHLAAGHDPKDGASLPQEAYTYDLSQEIAGKKAAVLVDYQTNDYDRRCLEQGVSLLRRAGIEPVEVKTRYAAYAHLALTAIAAAEGCNNVSRFDGVKYGYRAPEYKNMEELYCNSRSQGLGMEVKRDAVLGVYVLAKEQYQTYYYKALQVRHLLWQEMNDLFREYPLVLTPLAAGPPYAAGEDRGGRLSFRDRFYAAIPSLLGLPAVAFSVGRDQAGLPLPCQLFGAQGQDGAVFAAAAALGK
ncbi:MAG: hypothetical protein K6B40_04060 [Firmicutes bacterium]|nr:hypothetical protein [Bacillota bacterium]